jgi:hypothetical protein
LLLGGAFGVIVRLDNGEVLKLDPNSAAVLEANDRDVVTVTVLAGRVGMLGHGGRVLVAGSRSTFRVEPTAADPRAAEQALLGSPLAARTLVGPTPEGLHRTPVERAPLRD